MATSAWCLAQYQSFLSNLLDQDVRRIVQSKGLVNTGGSTWQRWRRGAGTSVSCRHSCPRARYYPGAIPRHTCQGLDATASSKSQWRFAMCPPGPQPAGQCRRKTRDFMSAAAISCHAVCLPQGPASHPSSNSFQPCPPPCLWHAESPAPANLAMGHIDPVEVVRHTPLHTSYLQIKADNDVRVLKFCY